MSIIGCKRKKRKKNRNRWTCNTTNIKITHFSFTESANYLLSRRQPDPHGIKGHIVGLILSSLVPFCLIGWWGESDISRYIWFWNNEKSAEKREIRTRRTSQLRQVKLKILTRIIILSSKRLTLKESGIFDFLASFRS